MYFDQRAETPGSIFAGGLMDPVYVVMGIIGLGLLIYLLISLIKPEWFN